MYCAKCGKEMDDSAKFCPACGADASGEADYAQTPDPAPSVSSSNSFGTEEQQSTGSGVGAMVCGIIGLVLCWVPIVGLILSIVALVLGSKGRKALPQDKRGMAIAGFVMGIIGLIVNIIVSLIWIMVVVFAVGVAGAAFSGIL